MAYLFEDKELVYEKQMASLKKRIILVNLTIFISNFFATLILIFNRMPFIGFLNLVLPVFVLNLVISYAILINKDSNEQLYLAMYISIIGTIVVMINIFINVPNPATYMLIYLAIAIISVFKDKKAVGLGYLIIFVFASIINFKYDETIINYQSAHVLTPYLFEGILIIILIVQSIRNIYNEKEIDDLYDELDSQKEVELKYHKTIFKLMADKNELERYTDLYATDETKERLYNYIDLFNESFYLKGNLKEKIDSYIDLQKYKNPNKILGKKLTSYQFKRELNYFEEMSTYKLTKLFSLLLSITYKNQKNINVDNIKNYELIFMNPDMSIEIQILGFIFLYEHLRNEKPHIHNLNHEQIVAYFKTNEVKEIFNKEIIDFFLTNEEIFNNIYENRKINEPDENHTETMLTE